MTETTDIFKAAFMMCMGGDLSDIRFGRNGKKIARFVFTGKNLPRHDRNYRNGKGLVNLVRLKRR